MLLKNAWLGQTSGVKETHMQPRQHAMKIQKNSGKVCQGVFLINFYWTVTKNHRIKISMDGRGRALDNIFVERLWRSVKYECIYLKEFVTVSSIQDALLDYFDYYNHHRFHQSLDYKTPAAVYLQSRGVCGWAMDKAGTSPGKRCATRCTFSTACTLLWPQLTHRRVNLYTITACV